MEQTQTNRRRRKPQSKPKWPKVLIGGIVLLILTIWIVAGYAYINNKYEIDLALNGDSEVILEYGSTYEEPGATAVSYGTHINKKPQPCDVQIKGNVDVTKLGTYTIEYQAVCGEITKTAKRTVTLVDTVPPQITLVSDPDHFTFPNQAYEEEGFSATDNYDGDLTAQVTATEADGKVIYTVSDSSGNEVTIERQIRYDDPVAPELSLKGNASVTITEGNKWTDPGYTASDNVDGDLTNQVTVSGKVDYQKPGTYKLTYEIKDGYGNTTKAERTVTVKAKPEPQTSTPSQNTGSGNNTSSGSNTSGDSQTSGKVIYLTFDDGPGQHTARLLNILAKYNAKATFFVCGNGKLDLLDDIAAGGHTLALHSTTHNYSKIYASESAFYDDLYGIQSIVKKYTGITATITRFPGGSSNSISKNYCKGIMTKLTKSIQEKGFTYFDWNIDSNDAGGAKTSAEVAQNVINGIKKSSRKSLVVLQHDIKGYSVDAVEEILQWGLANGCTFKALSADSPTCHHGVNN